MKITIKNEEQLYTHLAREGLKPGSTTKELCLALFGYATHWTEDAKIKIHQSLVASSYISVPAMFAKHLGASPDCSFGFVRAFLRGSYLVIVGSNTEIQVTFRGKVTTGLREQAKFICPLKSVPLSYRSRPQLLAKTLSRSLGKKVITKVIGKKIRWKFATIAK